MKLIYWVKYKVYQNVPPIVWEFFARKIFKLRERQYREIKRNYGASNPGTEFYVIRRRPPAWGLFSNILFVAQGLIYAKSKSYVPVVDMENYWVRELSSLRKINDSRNAWCYFFEQPSQYQLSEVYRSKNVILSDAGNIFQRSHHLSLKNQNLLLNHSYINEFRQIIKSYVRLNKITSDYIEQSFNQIQMESFNTLGIFVRGTSYFNQFTKENFSTPRLDFLFKAIEHKLDRINASNIFLVTEDFRMNKLIREKFDNIEFLDSLRFDSDLTLEKWQKNNNSTWDGGLKNMGYKKNLVYLTEIYLLSKLRNFIGTFSNATAFALGVSNVVDKDYTFVLKDNIMNVN
jgi:hypothetical protein